MRLDSAPDPPDDVEESKSEEPAEAAALQRRPMKRQQGFKLPRRVPKNLQKWPRCQACCFGIIIPIQLIVVVSLVSGLLLGKLEMEHEIQHNDAYMRLQEAETKFSSDLDTVFVDHLPNLCLGLYQNGVEPQTLQEVFEAIMTNQSLLQRPYQEWTNTVESDTHNTNSSTTNDHNLTEMAAYFSKCGKAGGEFREDWLGLFFQDVDDSSSPNSKMSFSFIRCVDRSSPLAFNAKIFPTPQDMHDALPSTQAELYAESWRKNQKELYAEYLQKNKTATELEALTKSYATATGQEKCSVNMPAAAWFWFTVMSTVGYGNQVPATVGGRLLTCTLGFFSILLFGGVLATAGGITAHVMNDFVHRFKTTVSRAAMVGLWGTLWVLWMLVITYQATSYNNTRMQQEFPMNDAYWFAFISTTTVGFGDYYMQPEGLFVSDLLGLWGNFLVGFVLLSAFLTEISNLLGGWVPNLSDDLQQNLKYAYEDQAVPEEILQQQSLRREKSDLRKSERRESLRKSSILRKQESENGRDWSHPVLSSQQSVVGGSRRRVASPTLLQQPDNNEEGQTASSNNSQEELLGEDDEDRDQEKDSPKPGIVAQRKSAFSPPGLATIPSSTEFKDTSNPSPSNHRGPAAAVPLKKSKKASNKSMDDTERTFDMDQSNFTHNPMDGSSMMDHSYRLGQSSLTPSSKAASAPPKSEPEKKPKSFISHGFNPAKPTSPTSSTRKGLFGHKSSPASEKAAKERAGAASPQKTPSSSPQKATSNLYKTPPKPQQARAAAAAASAPPTVNSGASVSSNLQPGAPAPPSKDPSNLQTVVTFVNKGIDPSMAKAELYYKATRWGPLGHGDPAVSVSTYPGDQWYIVANGVYAKMFTVAQGTQQQRFTI